MRSPSSASLTAILHNRSSRSAKDLVKPPGMCWAMRIAGLLAGSGSSTARIASVPPVEAPMITNFSLEISGAVSTAGRGALLGSAWRGRERAAARIFSAISSL
ncbi:hypothetical protein D3C86_1757490 [compost metagenome]